MLHGDDDSLRHMLKVISNEPALELLAGRWDKQLLTHKQILACKDMPSTDVMRATLLHTMESPATSLTGTLENAAGGGLARALEQHRKQLDGTDEAADAEAGATS